MFSNQRDSPEVLFIVFQRYSFFQFYLRPVYIRETKFLHPGLTDCWRYTERAFKERCNCPITLPTTLQRPLSWRSSTGPILANKSGKIGCGRTLSPGVKASANSASWHYWHKGLNSSRQCRSTVVPSLTDRSLPLWQLEEKLEKDGTHCWSYSMLVDHHPSANHRWQPLVLKRTTNISNWVEEMVFTRTVKQNAKS